MNIIFQMVYTLMSWWLFFAQGWNVYLLTPCFVYFSLITILAAQCIVIVPTVEDGSLPESPRAVAASTVWQTEPTQTYWLCQSWWVPRGDSGTGPLIGVVITFPSSKRLSHSIINGCITGTWSCTPNTTSSENHVVWVGVPRNAQIQTFWIHIQKSEETLRPSIWIMLRVQIKLIQYTKV